MADATYPTGTADIRKDQSQIDTMKPYILLTTVVRAAPSRCALTTAPEGNSIMDIKKLLEKRLQSKNYYAFLSILETALECNKVDPESAIPKDIFNAAIKAVDYDIAKNEMLFVLDNDLLVEEGDSWRLKEDKKEVVETFLDELKNSLQINYGQTVIDARQYLDDLTAYLTSADVNAKEIPQTGDKAERRFKWEDEDYRFIVSFTHVWSPILSKNASEKKEYTVNICPFYSQRWKSMFQYFPYKDFRDWIAFFDPWNGQKMNICKGGLLSYMDWFMRDVYSRKFLIPGDFREMLHENRLLRYDDEG